jgi:hypothetical protein
LILLGYSIPQQIDRCRSVPIRHCEPRSQHPVRARVQNIAAAKADEACAANRGFALRILPQRCREK